MAIIRTIIVKNDTVKLDFWDTQDDFMRHKVTGGQGIEVSLASSQRCPAMFIDSTAGKHHFVHAGNSGVPVPADCGTVVVDSTGGPVDVVLADPSLAGGIKRVTVVAVKLVHAIDVKSDGGCPVFDYDNIVFHTEGASFTFGAIQTDATVPCGLPDSKPPEADAQAQAQATAYLPPARPTNLPGVWAWYPVARYVPNFLYY